MNDERFEKVLQEMRDESLPREQVDAARKRVWRRLHASKGLACHELRPELADYALGRLSESRRLLLEDHLGRCVECRHALAAVKDRGKVVSLHPRPAHRPAWTRWAAAAAIVIVALYAGRGALDSAFAPSGPRATVLTVSGDLYLPSGATLTSGAEIGEGQAVRTAAGSRAVLQLRDGSRVEMNQRTEMAVQSARSGDTIRLSWGDLMIDAADQGERDLRVVTRDSVAAVKGTVFAVSSGTAGSLVSVVKGSVAVSQAGYDDLLHAGQQAASNPALGNVNMVEAISWSEGAPDYYALLADLSELEEQLASSTPSMRHEARLLPYLPANPGAYFAGPNLDDTIDQAIGLIDQRAAQNSALGEWWLSDSGREMRDMLEDLRRVTSLLGDELVVVLTGSEEPIPLFLAEVKQGGADELLRIIAATVEDGEMPPLHISGDLLLASDSPADLAIMEAQLGAGAGSPFAAEIADHYARGVGFLAAIDVGVFGAAIDENEVSSLLGLSTMRYLFVEQRSGVTGDETEATLSFHGAREGMASWLSSPGAIGSAEYVSAQAIAASAGSTRDPVEAFDQLFGVLGVDSELTGLIQEVETHTGINVRDDIAASLGTDFVFALEGMSVTEPMWMAAFEVMNPGALDESVRRLVRAANEESAAEGGGDILHFAEESVNVRTWKALSAGSAEGIQTLTWTYDHGYAVVATDRGVAQRAIDVRDSASSLIRSSRFQQQFPSNIGVHNSGFVWLDVSRLSEVMEAFGQQAPGLTSDTDPLLVVVTGDDDAIRWASSSRISRLLFSFLMM